MVRKHHNKKTIRRRVSRRSHRSRRTHKNRRGGGHGGLGRGPSFTSGASQVLKQMSPAPISGGFKKMARTLKRLLPF